MTMRLWETIVPARLGTSFRWLLAGSLVTNLGDGITLAAGPLLIASQTRDPFLVALAALLQRLPWLLFGVLAGGIADRVDRRRMIVVVDVLRGAVLVALTLTILTGTVSIAVVLTTMFVLGTAEVFADVTSGTLLPGLVESADLGIGNARMMGAFLTTNQLVGAPVGAFLFAIGMAWPFGVTALCLLLGAVLVSRISLRQAPVDPTGRHLGREIVEGLTWLWHHPAMRTLALTIVAFNVTFGAAWSVLVLYAQDRLGMDAVGFGLLTTASAVGGVVGMTAYGWLQDRFSLGNMMRAGLVVETLTHLALALNTSAVLAIVVMVAFGAHAFIWATTSNTIQHRAVPDRLRGRVGGVYMLGVQGGMVLGAAVGGLVARQWGVVGPFWFGFVGSALLVLVLWKQMVHVAHAGEPVASP